jgi:hypothetical protein
MKKLFLLTALYVIAFLAIFYIDIENRLIWSINYEIKKNKDFHGVVLIAKNEKIIHEKSHNCALVENQQFFVASIAKQVIAALVLRAAAKGKLQLSDSANKYLKQNQKINNAITIHHLLSHRSGISDDGTHLLFTPGEMFRYSNFGYKMLEFILENISNRPFSDIGNDFLKELKLKNSIFLYKGYMSFNYLMSNAHDLNGWNHRLHNYGVVSKKYYDMMLACNSRIDNKIHYGYALYVIDEEVDNATKLLKERMLQKNLTREITHHGDASGYRITLSYFPQTKISLVIMENSSTGNSEKDFRMHKNIRAIVKKYSSMISNHIFYTKETGLQWRNKK